MSESMSLPEEHLHILKHSVGYPKFYRNMFCAGIDSDDYFSCCILCKFGLMYEGKQINEGISASQYFYVSEEGMKLLKGIK